ncbi:hypothetical protein AX769_07375 [Frondihabitans sp. PAMC 28766]|uniref:sugar ABC transporter substrate-binding protein n=1 Tax=Frondihabitans sp. PAMC 28766 TaxID=1795630 RepID=UPI00078DE28A|nr:substrate-binding domain-containing protein [Frondihabitans sp. PAMC 28766]AMM20017.1 hypothetical protein AX769_07375 [Frondihabitans sp. PAMC 28766]
MRYTRVTRTLSALGLIALGAAVLSGCSSGTTPSGSASGGSAKVPSYLSSYSKELAAAEKPVSWDGPTTAAAAPKGILVGAVNCSYTEEGCKAGGEAFTQVAKALGWKAKSIVVNDPTGYAQAIQTLLNENVKAIFLGGVDESLVPAAINEAKARHIPVVSQGSNYNIGGSGQVDADVHANVTDEGKLMADAAMIDHSGTVNALVLNDAEFAEPVAVLKASKAQFASCSKCSIKYANPINFTRNVITNQLPTEVVSAMQTDPSINSIMIGFDPPAPYIVPALDTAGDKTKVTMYSQLGDSAPLQLVQDDNILKYDVASSTAWGTWGAFDEMIRYLDGKPLVNENLPLQVFTSSNPKLITKLGTNDFQATFAGYEKKYEQLWGVK